MKNSLSASRIGKSLTVWGIFIVVWMGALWLSAWVTHPLSPVSLSDLATVLFGAASIALFVFSIALAGIAIFGWQFIERQIDERVQKTTASAIERLEIELRGRVNSVMGFMLGATSLKRREDGSVVVDDRDKLEEGVILLGLGLRLLKKMEGSPAEFMALNNYVYFSSVLGEGIQREYLLGSARRLKSAAEERNEGPNLLLTYCYTVLKYSRDLKELEEARDTADSVKDHQKLSQAQRKEARFYLASLSQRIKELSAEKALP
jgi:hypothetical protein